LKGISEFPPYGLIVDFQIRHQDYLSERLIPSIKKIVKRKSTTFFGLQEYRTGFLSGI
jgi:hypothetical protein